MQMEGVIFNIQTIFMLKLDGFSNVNMKKDRNDSKHV